jgi:hypothetical protein
VEGGEPKPIAGIEAGEIPVQWSADGNLLYTRVARALPLKVFRLELSTGKKELFREILPADPTA